MSTFDPADPAPHDVAVTVAGEVAPQALGSVLPREHLLGDFAPSDAELSRHPLHRPAFYRAPFGMDLLGDLALGVPNRADLLLDDRASAVAEADAFRRAGGGTVVDATPPDLGRDPAGLRAVAAATGLHVVMATGRHRPAPDGAPPGAGALTEEFLRDLGEGVDGVRAGLVALTAALDPADPAERAVLVAAARASAATGAPVALTRSAGAGTQQRVLDLLEEEGAEPARIAVGGCDTLAPRPDDLEPLLARGVFVQFDRLGRLPSVHSVHDDQDVAAAVLELARRGHAGRLLLSQGAHARSHLLAGGGGGYGFVLGQFVPFLRMTGADDALVETLTVRNPRRFLTIPARRTDS
ncbi:phosphotriesterase [Kitasatospora sp. NPDC056327]|uniref:phosphotriesterase family protein n=1 Tax=Kitasatospora sp. NPDC056327 TaxID=3345785 RepID=UPI0035DD6444